MDVLDSISFCSILLLFKVRLGCISERQSSSNQQMERLSKEEEVDNFETPVLTFHRGPLSEKCHSP